MADFDTLSDLLSEGSNDSFFDEPGNTAKNKLKTSEKKQSVSDLFNLSGQKETENTTQKVIEEPKVVKKDDWLGVKLDEPEQIDLNKSLNPRNVVPSETVEVGGSSIDATVNKERNVPAPRESFKSNKKFMSDLFGDNDNTKPSKFDDILSDIKKKNVEPPKEKEKEVQIIDVAQKDSRESRSRGQKSALIDPLGLFSEEKSQRQREVKFSKSQPELSSGNKTDKNEIKVARLPDWLDGASKSDENKPSETALKAEQSVSGTNIPESEFTEESAPLGKIKNFEMDNTDSAMTFQQHLTATQMQFQNTSMALQQQEHQVLTALQLKRYEDNLNQMKKQQQDMLEKQEGQFKTLLDRQLAKQKIMENQLRMQQERINNHIQMLLAQPYVSVDGNKSLDVAGGGDSGVKEEVVMQAMRRRQEEEIEFLEESYKKQLSALEETLRSKEAYYQTEIIAIAEKYEAKIEELDKDNKEQIARYKQKINEINEQHILEINSLNEVHSRVVDEIKQEYLQLFENLKEAKKTESIVFENAGAYSQHLESSLQLLEHNSKFLTEINSKLERDHNIMSVTREETLKRKEEEIKMMTESLEKHKENAEAERSQLLSLVRTLESKLAQQSHEAKEQNLALQIAASTLAARNAALDREAEFNRNLLEREREQLKTLRETILADQEKNLLQISEEKMQLQAERTRLETAARLNSNRGQEASRAEIEAAIAVAREAAELTDREREKLCRQQQEVERMKRLLRDREMNSVNKEHELSVLTKIAEDKIKEADRMMAEARSYEVSYNEKLKEIKVQLGLLREREKNLAEEKMALARERLTLHGLLQKKKACGLCAADELPSSGKDFHFDEHVTQDVVPEMFKRLDPEIIRLQLEIEGDELNLNKMVNFR